MAGPGDGSERARAARVGSLMSVKARGRGEEREHLRGLM